MVGSGRLAFACPDVLAVLVDVTAVGGSVANLCQAALEVAALHELGRYHDLTVRVHIAPPVVQFHTGFDPREAVGCLAARWAIKLRADYKLSAVADVAPCSAAAHSGQTLGEGQRRKEAGPDLQLTGLVDVSPAFFDLYRSQPFREVAAAVKLQGNDNLPLGINKTTVIAAEHPGQPLAELASKVVLRSDDNLAFGVQIAPPRLEPEPASLFAEVVQILIIIHCEPRPSLVNEAPLRPDGHRREAFME